MNTATVLLLIVFANAVLSENLPCPTNPRALGCPEVVCNMMNSRKTDFCNEVQCEGITPENCIRSESVFEKGLTMCGCCDGCAKYLDVGDPCEASLIPTLDPNCTNEFCPILKNKCKLGLVCNYLGSSSKKCAYPNPDEDEVEQEDKEKCLFKRNLGLTKQLHWIPTCEMDGTYSPRQCKGTFHDGICFCVDSNGKRIFGMEWQSKAQDQNCACSRQVHELREAGNIAAIHCSSDGNYEPLQCDIDSGVCYCVDPKTGKLDGAVLPEHQWKNLPCYSVNLTNWDPTGQYLRICESQWATGQRIKKEAELHGLYVYATPDLKCDYDGSYAPVQRFKDSASEWYCTSKDGTRGPHHQILEESEMNCHCYRDSSLYPAAGRPFSMTCDLSTGNYDPVQKFDAVNEIYKCVDKDGFFFGDEVDKAHECCLLGDCSRESDDIKNKCYDPLTNPNGFRSCSSWPT